MFVNSYNVRTFAPNLKQGIFNPVRMRINTFKRVAFTILFLSVFSFGFANETKDGGDDEKFDPKQVILLNDPLNQNLVKRKHIKTDKPEDFID